MSVSGIMTALFVGAVVGLLGRLLSPDRRRIPGWLPLAIGVASALLGAVIARLILTETAGVTAIELAVQIGLSTCGVAIVIATAGPRSNFGSDR